MSEAAVKQVIDRAVGDAKFRQMLFRDPDSALQGYDLTDEERNLLSDVDEDNFDEFAGGLGDRTTKGKWIPGAG
ncbi:MAG TPA: Franean1_4349 family RiPP [Anaerolineae bacterium]